ncbi:hypothetical protein BV20DRAFT_963655 [Pilatotrama ljubarskyi]|nr:hypothetical protein BV20DRAFT_963655 [Pilatotrama ljubarskyi]
MASLERRKTVVSAGLLPHSSGPDKTEAIASSHPFTQQVDVVFPACPELEEALLKLQCVYRRCECTLSEFLTFAMPYVIETAPESKVVAVGLPRGTSEDVWCLDSRGFLTLMVGKETYECLGLVGETLPWKERSDAHVLHVSLRRSRPSSESMKKWLAYGSKEAGAVRRWDTKTGPWKILYHCDSAVDEMPFGSTLHQLSRTAARRENVYMPHPQRNIIVSQCGQHGDAAEDWEESVSSLFEWIGLACLGSPRLSANDRCDPYVAVYTPPELSRVGNISTIRWSGFIPSAFTRMVLDSISSPNLPSPSFVAVTGQSVGTSPVTYLPGEPSKPPPLRAPRADAEDTWSLVYARDTGEAWWVLAESVGQWDKRWG